MEIINLEGFSHHEVVEKVAAVLKSGGLVIYPTDTVYGVAVDATNEEAVKKLLAYKGKHFTKPIPIAVDSLKMAEEYVELNTQARNLYQNFLPGPLTVISKSKHRVSTLLEPPTGTLGVRMIDYPLVNEILSTLGRPITTTSAVSSGRRPYSLDSILQEISQSSKECIDVMIDAGILPKAEPSAVVDTTFDQDVVLRGGILTLEEVDETTTHQADETIAYGRKMMEQYAKYLDFKSVIFALSGDLGAGKTHFTKGIAKALDVKEEVQSPTFILEREYEIVNQKHLYHLDVWRIQAIEEVEVLGLEEKVEAGNVFVIEWAERIESWFDTVKDNAVILWVDFRYGQSETERCITVRIHV